MPDVVVIGAGPAGLACAAALDGLDVLVLEATARPGGRIRTVQLGGQAVDTGACFAFDAALLPSGAASLAGALVQERGPLGLAAGGAIHLADTPLECIARLAPDRDTLGLVERFARGDADAATLDGTRAHALFEALLHQIHPGALRDYDPQHQRDGLYTWYPDHWEAGNGCLVDALLERGTARLQCDAPVSAVSRHGAGAQVRYSVGGAAQRLECRAVVIATTATVARELWPDAPPAQRDLLSATCYGAYLVVALAGEASPLLGAFRSIVPVDGVPLVVSQQRSPDRQRATLLCYFPDAGYAALAAMPDAELVALARQRIAGLGVARAALDRLEQSAVHRWPQAATILDTAYRRSRARAAAVPADDAIVLAGDYASPEPGVGYGIEDAVVSGRSAAARVRALLGRPSHTSGRAV